MGKNEHSKMIIEGNNFPKVEILREGNKSDKIVCYWLADCYL
jgi:hypothetical protein